MEESKISDIRLAYQLIGEFFFHFAQLEEEINNGIGKLLSLEGGILSIVASNMDFRKKVNVLRSTEDIKAAIPDAKRLKFLKTTFNNIDHLNLHRIRLAHYSFTYDENAQAVIYNFSKADVKLNYRNEIYRESDFKELYKLINQTINSIKLIVEEMIPYQPKLDFKDPRNSMYIPLLSGF